MSEYIPEGLVFEALMVYIPDAFLKEFLFKYASPKTTRGQELVHAVVPCDELLNSFKLAIPELFGKSFSEYGHIMQVKLQELFLILSSAPARENILNFIHTAVNNEPVDIDYIVQQYLLEPLSVEELLAFREEAWLLLKGIFKKNIIVPPGNGSTINAWGCPYAPAEYWPNRF